MQVELIVITPNAEKVIEEAGRTAYLSFDKASEESTKKFIRMIIKRGHTSVLEHASATFKIRGGSRAFTHQVTRHRLCAFTQQSQRYINESNFNYVIPKSIENNKKAYGIFNSFVAMAKHAYKQLQDLGIKNEDARFILPNAVESEIVVTANLREWRHIINLRGKAQAQWEIRAIILEILKILKKHVPTCFEDFKIIEDKQIVERNT